jgi:hypothetical protein
LRPGVGLRLRTWWQRDRLDEQLAEGADPTASPELTLRAEQLGSDAERVRLADAIELVLRESREPATMSHLLVRRRQVYACVDDLLALALRLRDGRPVDVRGAAMTALLLSEGRSPLYYERSNVRLPEAVRAARLALGDGDQTTEQAVRTAA